MSKKKLFSMLCLLVVSAVFAVGFMTGSSEIAYAQANGEIYYGAFGETVIGHSVTSTETINYATKTITYKKINPIFPNCYNRNADLTNCCACTAGANVINYYDRYYDELIPDYTAGFFSGTKYIYYGLATQATKKQGVINTLYSYMKTNTAGAGTTQSDYKNGLKQYVNEKNRQITYTSILTVAGFDASKLLEQIDDGKIISLYLNGLNFCSLSDGGNTAKVSIYEYPNTNHIEIVYGYQIIDYFDANGSLITSKTFLYVASGINGVEGMYLVNNNGVVIDAETVTIF